MARMLLAPEFLIISVNGVVRQRRHKRSREVESSVLVL
jgi:hypothetical protein